MSCSRRRFVKNTALWSAGLLADAGGMLLSCQPLSYVAYQRRNNRLVIKKTDLGDKQYVLLNTTHLPASVYLYRKDDGSFSAVLLECTHLSCELEPYGSKLQCPCHGSTFKATGKVLTGPAETDLKTFNVHEDETHIYIE